VLGPLSRDFGQGSAYDPQGPQRWLSCLLIAVGWVFVTTVAAGSPGCSAGSRKPA
jgi:hypothetical protein